MQEKYEKEYHSLEEEHWWFVGRRNIISSLVEKYPKGSRILEVGCSGGELIKDLNENGYKNIFGVDISKKAIELCKKRGVGNVYLMDGESLEFDEKFDLIILSDVLEHIGDEKKTLEGLRNSLKKGGKVICFVPAFKSLWSYHDELNKHYRRYTRKRLSSVFEDNGFIVRRKSYWNFFLFFPIYLSRKFINSKNGKSQLRSHSLLINNLLTNLLKFENLLLKGFNFPFGISVFLLGEKK